MVSVPALPMPVLPVISTLLKVEVPVVAVTLPVRLPVTLPVRLPVTLPVIAPSKPLSDLTGPENRV